MNKNLNKKTEKETPRLNTLKVLLRSLKNQLEDLKSVNKNIDKLEAELNGGTYQKKKKEKVGAFGLGQVQTYVLKG